MRRPTRTFLTMLATTVLLTAPACGDDDATESTASAASHPLPFGLQQVEGTIPIGRPAVHRDALIEYGGTPIHGTKLHAAYRVTDDQQAALQAWVEQVAALGTLHRIQTNPYGAFGLSNDGALGYVEYLDLQVWATDDGPILLVGMERSDELPPADGVPTEVVDTGGVDVGGPEALGAPSNRGPGDDLFEEQGTTIHLPDGTHDLMPTLPTQSGTGGSTSILAAADAGAAIQALLDEADAASDQGDTTGPTESEYEGVRVVTASYEIPAGGWGFDVVAVQGPDDEEATLFVTSSAD
jgi:hypothetical protein